MVFPDAGRGHTLKGLFAVEGVRLDYRGDWPEPHPIRLVLETGVEFHAEVDEAGHVATIQVPPGEQLRLRLSTALDRQRLAWLGLWRSLPSALQSLDLLAEAAADGWFWWLTPATEVRLVHAVPKPVEVPRPTVMLPFRTPADTAVALVGAVDVHGPSTERLDLEASWSEWIDDIAKPAPSEVAVRSPRPPRSTSMPTTTWWSRVSTTSRCRYLMDRRCASARWPTSSATPATG